MKIELNEEEYDFLKRVCLRAKKLNEIQIDSVARSKDHQAIESLIKKFREKFEEEKVLINKLEYR